MTSQFSERDYKRHDTSMHIAFRISTWASPDPAHSRFPPSQRQQAAEALAWREGASAGATPPPPPSGRSQGVKRNRGEEEEEQEQEEGEIPAEPTGLGSHGASPGKRRR